MRLYQQLVLFMLAATVLPLAVVGFMLLRSSEDELILRIGEAQQAHGVLAARDASAELVDAVEVLGRATEAIDWAAANMEERKGALALLYQQADSVAATALVDADGVLLAGPIHRTGEDGHPGFEERALPTLLKAVPLQPLRGGNLGQAGISRAYAGPSGEAARIAVAVKAGQGPEAPFVLAELGFEQLERGLQQSARAESARFDLVDSKGRIVASSEPGARFAEEDSEIWTTISSTKRQQHSFSTRGPPARLVSVVPLPDELGFRVVVSQDEAAALGPVDRMRKTVLVAIGVALIVLLGLGAAFTRRMNGRIGRVVEGAEAYGRGDLAWRIPVNGADELTDLAVTFNKMGAELEGARARLLRWNDDLRQKVDEATADLRAAQAQLVEAQKLAAVGQLGAGVAHEINNPLAGILGNAQLLMLDRDEKDPDFDTLKKIELSAKRCKEITQNLLRFSQQRDRPELRPVSLNGIVKDALSLTQNQLKGDGIAVELALTEGKLQVTADPGHFQQVLLAVISNARTAMLKSETKVLRVRTAADGNEAVVTLEDTGKGIKPEHLPRIFEPFFTTKDIWSNVGLGLSVAYRVVSEHKGKIDVQSEPGQGTRVTVRLPLAATQGQPARTAA